MPQFIQKRRRTETFSYSLDFDYADEKGSGFSFPCDEHGNVNLFNCSDVGRQNFAKCLSGDMDGKPMIALGVIPHVTYWMEPAIIRCDCGADVTLHTDGVQCDQCKQTYNLVGQRLRPESEWEE
jgi:hypothetical protein